MPTLLGVGCIDMNLIVALDTVRARADWADFDARVTRERAACPRVKLTEPQLETLRRSVSEAAVCGDESSDDESSDDATSSDDEGATAGAVAGGVLGGLVAICLLVSSLVYRCRLKSQANAANIQTAARAASSTTGQAQQMTNTHLQVALPISQGTPLSGSSSSTTGQAHPTGNLYPQAYAVGTPVC